MQPKLSGAGKFSKAGAEKRKLFAADSAGAFQHVLADVVPANVMNETETVFGIQMQSGRRQRIRGRQGNLHAIFVQTKHVGLVRAVEHVFYGGANKVGKLFEEGLHLLLGESAHDGRGGEVQLGIPRTVTEWH